jgi:hypothetical protein
MHSSMTTKGVTQASGGSRTSLGAMPSGPAAMAGGVRMTRATSARNDTGAHSRRLAKAVGCGVLTAVSSPGTWGPPRPQA